MWQVITQEEIRQETQSKLRKMHGIDDKIMLTGCSLLTCLACASISISLVTTFTGFSFCQFTQLERRLRFQKNYTLEPSFKSLEPAHRCHVKERLNCDKSLLFDEKNFLDVRGGTYVGLALVLIRILSFVNLSCINTAYLSSVLSWLWVFCSPLSMTSWVCLPSLRELKLN